MNHYHLIASSEDVSAAVDRIATQIIQDYPTTPIFIALLRGAAPFASKLMFALTKQQPNYHPEIDYMLVSTYGPDHTAKQPVIVTDLAPTTSLVGRDVVILDDTIDLGITSDFIHETLLARGASSVKLAVLASKSVPSRYREADYIGFAVGDAWLVGMGLDDAKATYEAYRWTESLWEIPHD